MSHVDNFSEANRVLVTKSKTSFYWAMRLLSQEKRDAMYAIYSFCRIIDDIADQDGASNSEKLHSLNIWRQEIKDLFNNKINPNNPIIQGLSLACKKFSLRQENFEAIIDGMEMDIDKPICRPTMDELDLYCARVASAVGMLCIKVFGLEEKIGDLISFHLGRALQLTNILRDLDEDMQRERLYLPEELLNEYGIKDMSPQKILAHPNINNVCRKLAFVAEQHFKEANHLTNSCPRTLTKPIRLISAYYNKILFKLIDRGWKNCTVPVKISKFNKIVLILRYSFL
ncbi:MAG: presqualene diphosphate synthase HpnD [Alphaproteobacteria bacterium]|nr:presqualene diphosphate synthase HpnD [Alphaproteobacteria bacterium]